MGGAHETNMPRSGDAVLAQLLAELQLEHGPAGMKRTATIIVTSSEPLRFDVDFVHKHGVHVTEEEATAEAEARYRAVVAIPVVLPTSWRASEGWYYDACESAHALAVSAKVGRSIVVRIKVFVR